MLVGYAMLRSPGRFGEEERVESIAHAVGVTPGRVNSPRRRGGAEARRRVETRGRTPRARGASRHQPAPTGANASLNVINRSGSNPLGSSQKFLYSSSRPHHLAEPPLSPRARRGFGLFGRVGG